MPDLVTALSPAKVNLTLDVFQRRPDGFHDLATVFQTISLFDRLEVRHTAGPRLALTCDSADVPADARNLAWRAAALLMEASRCDGGISIHLSKSVPAQAGLGGGSSNAAAALVAVNALLEMRLSDEQMVAVASHLGSDVPFFLTGGTVLATGRGERVASLPAAPKLDLVIAKPSVGVSTAWAYRELDGDAGRRSASRTLHANEAIRAGDRQGLLAALSNDFECVVLPACPEIADARDALLAEGVEVALLCGSGAAVMGVARDAQEAAEIAERLTGRFPFVTACTTVDASQALVINVY